MFIKRFQPIVFILIGMALFNAPLFGNDDTSGNLMGASAIICPGDHKAVLAGNTLTFDVTAAKFKGDPVTFSCINCTSGAVIDPNTGVFHWTPAAADCGLHSVEFVACDANSICDTSLVNIVVLSNSANAFFIGHFIDTLGNPHPVDLIITDGVWTQEFWGVSELETEVPCYARYLMSWLTPDLSEIGYDAIIPSSPGGVREFDVYPQALEIAGTAVSLENIEAEVFAVDHGSISAMSQEYSPETKTLTIDMSLDEDAEAMLVMPRRYVDSFNDTIDFGGVVFGCGNQARGYGHGNGCTYWQICSYDTPTPHPYDVDISIEFAELSPSMGQISVASVLSRGMSYVFSAALTDIYDPAMSYDVVYRTHTPSFYNIPPGSYILTVNPEDPFGTQPMPPPMFPPALAVNMTPDVRNQPLWIYCPTVSELVPFTFYIAADGIAANSYYANLDHRPGDSIVVDVGTMTQYDWWGCFVLPDTLAVSQIIGYPYTGGVDTLGSFTEWIENRIHGYNLVTVRTDYAIARLNLTYHAVEEQHVIKIEKTHGTLQGHYVDVPVTIENSDLPMGGFDFLIAYDASALAFVEAEAGQLLEDCGWEYFSYRHGVEGTCGDACPSGLMRIIALAETNNGASHPSCYGPPDTDPHELATMKFYVSNDRTYECQYVPIRFFWDDCNDNAISSIDGEILYIDRAIYDFEGNLIWNEDDDDQFPEDERIPFLGAPDYCLNSDPDKPSALRLIEYVDGGVDIVCSDSIDARGDLNVNGVVNEIADAVMFTNYFISGLSAFGGHHEASIAASDVNADGIALSVADLVYLVRIITGDAPPYPKAAPYTQTAAVSLLVNHSAAAVSTVSPVDIGAGYFVFDHTGFEIGEPQLINGASDMNLKYYDDNGVLKVIVYSMEKGVKIPAGTENIFAIPTAGEGHIGLTDVQLSDYFGNLLEINFEKQTSLPKTFALHQNYPNPFNAGTTIIYELPTTAHVTIEVYNVLGQKVVTLFDAQESAGIHSVVWDANDESGMTVSSGVYLYRITVPGFTSEKKMVLMK